MRIHNLYCDASGVSHWRDIEVQWLEDRNFSKLSARLPATGIIFRETSGDYDLSWHPAPRRQYIINLDGGVQITASDGQARTIGAGEVVLVEDTSGKGHLSKSVGGKMRRSIFVPVEERELTMKLAFFDDYKLGVVKGDTIYDVSSAVRDIPHLGPHDLINGLIARYGDYKKRLEDASASGGKPLSSVKLQPPLPKP